VVKTVSDAEYRALAELRYRIRHFIQEGDAAAQRSNLEPQQYLMLLAIRGLPHGAVATIRTLAERMALKHHSAVELIDRLESHGLVRRSRNENDKREVRVSLLPPGSKLLDRVARERLSELKASGAALADAITALVEQKHPSQMILQINEIIGNQRRPSARRDNTAPVADGASGSAAGAVGRGQETPGLETALSDSFDRSDPGGRTAWHSADPAPFPHQAATVGLQRSWHRDPQQRRSP
jgi:DNA-binding MarR family transcriptional regulator